MSFFVSISSTCFWGIQSHSQGQMGDVAPQACPGSPTEPPLSRLAWHPYYLPELPQLAYFNQHQGPAVRQTSFILTLIKRETSHPHFTWWYDLIFFYLSSLMHTTGCQPLGLYLWVKLQDS